MPEAAPKFPPCRGISDSACNYLWACGTACNKCGKVHDGKANPKLRFDSTAAAPTVVEPRNGYTEQEWQDAKLRGIASDYFQDSMHWPAAILCMKHLLKELAATPPRAAQSITITGHQLHAALDFVSPQRDADQLDSEVTIAWREVGVDTEGEAFEAGLCCWLTEYPEEGCIPLTAKVE